MKRILDFLRRVARIPCWFYWEINALVLAGYFWLLNLYGRTAITQPRGPVVSLTTYGTRTRTVCLAIESIARGRVLPSRMILWIDDKAVSDNLPASIRRLAQRGLEVRFCKNYGPHKKYYPYLESLQEIEAPLVTADDDLLYPRTWLKGLVEAFKQFPDAVNCYRARVMLLNHDGIAKYESWALADSTEPSFRHFAIGVAGVIYPLSLQRALKHEGEGFLSSCPKADDIWLHVQAIRAGYKIRQIDKREFRLIYIPRTQSIGLRTNNMFGGNDMQVKATYTESDIYILRHKISGDVQR